MRRVIVLAVVLLTAGASSAGHAQPTNGSFESSIEVAALPFSQAVDTNGQSRVAGEPEGSCGEPGPSVWYRFLSDRSVVVTVATADEDVPTSISLYGGSSAASLKEQDCSVDDGPGGGTTLTFLADPGVSLAIQVAGVGDAVGRFRVEFSEGGVPQEPSVHSNDDFVNAEVIPGLPFQSAAGVVLDSAEEGEPIPTCPFDRRRTIWYRYHASADQDVLLSNRGNRHDLGFISIYTGTDVAHLHEETCVWTWTGATTRVFRTRADTTYFIQVGSDAEPSVDSSMAGFGLSVAPAGDVEIHVETEGPQPDQSPTAQTVIVDIVNNSDLRVGPNNRFLVTACPKTAGTCAYLGEIFFELEPRGSRRAVLSWAAAGWAGQYEVTAEMFFNSYVETRPDHAKATSSGHVVAPVDEGVGLGPTAVIVTPSR